MLMSLHDIKTIKVSEILIYPSQGRLYASRRLTFVDAKGREQELILHADAAEDLALVVPETVDTSTVQGA